MAYIFLFSALLQTQQQTSPSFFDCLQLELYIYAFACCIVGFCCLFFYSLFVCLCDYHVIIALICTYLCSYGLALCIITLLQFSVFLVTDISVYDLVQFIYFVLLFIQLLVNTCINTYIFLHFVVLKCVFVLYSLFVCNELSSETWVFGVHNTCLKVLQGSQVLASRYVVVAVLVYVFLVLLLFVT